MEKVEFDKLNKLMLSDLLVFILLIALVSLITNWHIDARFDKLEKKISEIQK